MVQAVISLSLLVVCFALSLLMFLRRTRVPGATERPDDLDGLRAVPVAPLPDLPAAGAAPVATADPIVPALAAPVTVTPDPLPVRPNQPVANTRSRNSGFSRFGTPAPSTRAAAGRL